jgi:CrcB protein
LTDRPELLAIFAGGCAGALARAGLAEAFPTGAGWPWATFVANIAGAFILGYTITLLQERMPPTAYRRPLIGTGFCGALTTFSTVQVELLDLIDSGRAGLAAAYALTSIVAGYGVVVLASGLVRRA